MKNSNKKKKKITFVGKNKLHPLPAAFSPDMNKIPAYAKVKLFHAINTNSLLLFANFINSCE